MNAFLARTAFCFCLLFSAAVSAAPDVPEIHYAQKVNIVVTAKKDPRILDFKITQAKKDVTIDVIVDQSVDREDAKEMALVNIMQVKSLSLDDAPTKAEEPGKGLFDYAVNYYRPDGVLLLKALKPAKKSKITLEDPVPLMMPATRADAAGR